MLVSLVFQLLRPLYISFDCDKIIEFNFWISGWERVEWIREFSPPPPIGTSLCALRYITLVSSAVVDAPTRPSKPTQPTLPCKPTTSVSNNNNVNPEQNRQSGDYKIGESWISADWRAKNKVVNVWSSNRWMIICHRQEISETEGMSPSLFADCEKVVLTLKSNGWSSEVDIAEASKLFVFLFYLIDSDG